MSVSAHVSAVFSFSNSSLMRTSPFALSLPARQNPQPLPTFPTRPPFVRQNVTQPGCVHVHRRLPIHHNCHPPEPVGVQQVAGTREGGEVLLLLVPASVVDDGVYQWPTPSLLLETLAPFSNRPLSARWRRHSPARPPYYIGGGASGVPPFARWSGRLNGASGAGDYHSGSFRTLHPV